MKSYLNKSLLGGALCFMLTGCGAPSTTASSGSIDYRAVDQRAARLFERIAGDNEEWLHIDLVQYAETQDAILTCMASNKFNYSPPPFASLHSAESVRPLLIDYLAFSTLGDPGVQTLGDQRSDSLSVSQAKAAEPNPGFELLDKEGKQTYLAALRKCAPSTDGLLDGNAVGGSSQQDLLKKFYALLDNVSAEVEGDGDLKRYGPCMREAGFAISTSDDIVAFANVTFNEASTTDTKSPAWATAVEKERHMLSADSTCREPARISAAKILDPELAAFESDHKNELLKLDTAWASVADAGNESRETVARLDPAFTG